MAIKGLTFACFMFLAFAGNAASKKLYITADDEIVQLYVNGVSTSFGPGGWPTVRTVDIPDSVSVIAVKSIDIANIVAGILASSDDGSILTGSNWKCSTQYAVGWETLAFDDASWPSAVISGDHSASDIHGVLSPISLNAKWIWTQNYRDPSIDKTVYCRINIAPKPDDEYTCGQCSNPCTPANAAAGKFYFKHTTKDHFVQCSQWGQCYVMPCAPGTVWNQSITTCDWP